MLFSISSGRPKTRRVWALWATLFPAWLLAGPAPAQNVPTLGFGPAQEVLAEAEGLLRSGRAEEALPLFEAVANDANAAPRDQAIAFGGVGLSFSELDLDEQSAEAFGDSVELALSIGADDVAATSEFNLGAALLGGSSAPFAAAPEPLPALSANPLRSGARSPRSGAAIRVSVDLARQAAARFTEAGRIAEAGALPALAARSFGAALATRMESPERDVELSNALEDLAAAADAIDAMPAGDERTRTALAVGENGLQLIRAGGDSIDAGAPEPTFRALHAAKSDAAAAGDALLEAQATGALGELYGFSEDRLDEAILLTEQAVGITEEAIRRDPASWRGHLLFRWQGQLARLYELKGERGRAYAAYGQAEQSIEQRRPVFASERLDRAFGELSPRSFVEPILMNYARFLLSLEPGDPLLPPGAQPAILARDVVERIRRIDLDEFFEEMCVANIDQSATQPDLIAPNTAVLYPIVFDDRIEIVLTIGGVAEPVVETARVGRDQIARLVGHALLNVQSSATVHAEIERPGGGPPRLLVGFFADLYDILAAPVVPHLEKAGVHTVVFAPDSTLQGLPLAALYDRDADEYFIEKFAVGTAYGLSLVDPTRLSRVGARGLLAGVSEPLSLDGDAESGFSALDAVADELDEIAKVLPSDVLFNEAFTKSQLADRLESAPFSVLHIASHAEYTGARESSFLLLHGAREGEGDTLSIDELRAIARKTRLRGEPIELLTLSACDTGVGRQEIEVENALLGLAGVAYRSGARSVLASLWKIVDASTSVLMQKFYEEMFDGAPGAEGGDVTKAEALRRAQIALLNNDPAVVGEGAERLTDQNGRPLNTSHPNYWAGFVLLGNWL